MLQSIVKLFSNFLPETIGLKQSDTVYDNLHKCSHYAMRYRIK